MRQILLLLTAILTMTITYSQPGTIDKTYGTDKTGIATIATRAFIQASAIQPDDKLVAVGLGYANKDYAIFRNNQDGSVDSSFGIKGVVTTTFDDLIENLSQIYGWQGIAVQQDGKIIATGTAVKFKLGSLGDPPYENDVVLARFMADGSPDESSGNKGRLVTDLGKQETATSIATQEDGKIVVAGFQQQTSNGDFSHILILRYNSDGSPDASFGEGKGYVLYTNTLVSNAYALLIQPDNKIVAGGSSDADSYFFLVRYLPDGTVDATFGNGGEVKTNFGVEVSDVKINSLALDEGGRIVAAGVADDEQKAEVVRYLPDGVPDNTFGKEGKVELTLKEAPYIYLNTVLAQPEGKLVITGVIVGNGLNYWTPFLTGLKADGSIDSSFGNDNGQTVTNISFLDEFSNDAVVQKDGKIIVCGNKKYSSNPDESGYILVRFHGYPTKVPLFVRIKRWLQNHGISWKGLPPEDNIAYYSIERSNNSRTGFTQIAKVSGVNNLKNYSFTNNNLLQGENYYRVKAVSGDGTVRYSEVASADNTPASASLYPNPVRNYVTVQGLKTSEKSNISIANGSGTVLAKGVSNGSTQYRTPTSNLQPGTYYIHITTGSKTEALKFVKE